MFKDMFRSWTSSPGAVAAFIISTSALAAAQQGDLSHIPPDALEAAKLRVADELGLAECDLQLLDVPVAVRAPISMDVSLDGFGARLELSPISVRAENFAVFAQRNGRLQRIEPAAPHTYRGSIAGRNNTIVTASIAGSGFRALIHDGGQTWSIQPAPAAAGLGIPNVHVIYKGSDLLPGPWQCGAPLDGVPAGPAAGAMAQPVEARGVTATCTSIAELAIDVDHDYYILHNTIMQDVLDDVEAVINSVNLIYGFQVGVNFLVTEIVVQTDAFSDPFTQTSAGALLDEFLNYRNANPYLMNPDPDEAHLFTGKQIEGNVIGVAYLGAVCNDLFHYGLSQSRFTDVFLLRTVLTAHELGHNWDARHCDADFDCGIMCSAVASCAGDPLTFGDRSVASIVAFRDSIDCLQQGATIFNTGGQILVEQSDANLNDNFGTSVDIVDNLAIIGAYSDDEAGNNAGAAYIYEFDGVEWVQLVKLMPDLDPIPTNDRFGVSVALDVTGFSRSALVGAYLDTGVSTISGSVYVFTEVTKEGKTTWEKTQKIVRDPKKMGGDLFGFDIDISGNLLIIGAPRADNKKGKDSGAAFIYGRGLDNLWVLQDMVTAGKDLGAPNDQFGTSVAIDWDTGFGATAVVGAWMDDCDLNNTGAVYIFRNSSGADWVRDAVWCHDLADDQFGYAVAIEGDTIAASAWLNDEIAMNAGSVIILRRGGDGQWSEFQTLTEPDLSESDNYGSAVAIQDNLLAIGAYRSDAHINNGGAVYAYRRTGPNGMFVPFASFEPKDLGDNDQMGLSVAISGSLIITGAWFHDDTASNQGAAHIFVADNEPTDCNENDVPDNCDIEFGTAVDCNFNGLPDDCDIASGFDTDLDGNGIPDSCDTDCNNNGITDTTEIAQGLAPDCNENGFPDSCDVDPLDPDGNGEVSEDINGDGIPDECSPDCNGNGIPDNIDISDMTSQDCNGNGVPDECDRGEFHILTPQLGPIGAGDEQSLTLNSTTQSPPWAMSDVTIQIVTSADLDLSTEYYDLLIDGIEFAELFRSGALDCPADDGEAPDVETRTIPASLWNAALRLDQEVIVELDPNSSVDAMLCTSGSWATIEVTYQAGDCNNNGILDICETDAGTVPDCNSNGVPDVCELADYDLNMNGIPDDCDTCPADFNADGDVDVFDLFDMLADWGPCPGCPTDLTNSTGGGPDGNVDVFDLFVLLAQWGGVCP